MDNNGNICPHIMPHSVEYPDSIDCTNCWKYNENIPRDKIKLNNRKYCWMYQMPEIKELKSIVPLFQNCQTLYTKCDYLLEQSAHEVILKLEDQFKAHCSMLEKEMKMQNELVDDMWTNSQKYFILNGSGICVKPYPEIISAPTEKRLLCSFHLNLRRVNESNYRMTKSLDEIRDTMAELKRRLDRLDNTVESPFLVGSYYLRSLKYIRTTIDDLSSYLYQHLCKLMCWAELLDPGDCVAIEDYMALIKPNEEYENNLIEYLNPCHCMRPKRKACIKRHTQC